MRNRPLSLTSAIQFGRLPRLHQPRSIGRQTREEKKKRKVKIELEVWREDESLHPSIIEHNQLNFFSK